MFKALICILPAAKSQDVLVPHSCTFLYVRTHPHMHVRMVEQEQHLFAIMNSLNLTFSSPRPYMHVV